MAKQEDVPQIHWPGLCHMGGVRHMEEARRCEASSVLMLGLVSCEIWRE